MPGNSNGFGIISGRWFVGMNFGAILMETWLAPESKILKSILSGAQERVTSSEPQAPVAKAMRKAVL